MTAGVPVAPGVALRSRAMHSPWTTHRAISARAHRKTAAARAVASVEAITAAPLPIWAALLTVVSRRVPRKVASLIPCVPALT